MGRCPEAEPAQCVPGLGRTASGRGEAALGCRALGRNVEGWLHCCLTSAGTSSSREGVAVARQVQMPLWFHALVHGHL